MPAIAASVPAVIQRQLTLCMQDINDAWAYADRFGHDEKLFAQPRQIMLEAFEQYPGLKDIFNKIFIQITGSNCGPFSLSDIKKVKYHPVFCK